MSKGSHEEDLPQQHESDKHLQLPYWGQIEHRKPKMQPPHSYQVSEWEGRCVPADPLVGKTHEGWDELTPDAQPRPNIATGSS